MRGWTELAEMSDLYLYDTSLSAVSSSTPITVLVTDRSGTTLARPTVGPLLAGHGASINVAGAHDIFVDDSSKTLASAVVAQMNGSQSYRVNLVLYPLPVAGVGSALASGLHFGTQPTVNNSLSVRKYLQQQRDDDVWTQDEVHGVQLLYQTTLHALATRSPAVHLRKLTKVWLEMLADLGIENKD